ncbi:universal stress protein [Algoriphagus aquimarinus]|uniref:Nucleotide-binding universal stress protein, UspA family n=1 Tax=Algoriphagus aquimarinus TaxID=237018 RepID=A0A1I0YC05_9BACT|nr:universal stress protein [Algoriphagus aquimarinus]SFB09928.1 Nucleotide-binding universal stress protein, UspA family [Algoriphagus aquimarinus]|tara:strand:+ start:8703 stop:9554 length:852 start_codon:yes stop_codon:yes gene_type:complete
MTKVLVPFDFSEQAQNALDLSANLSNKFDSVEITVLHVIEVPSTAGMGTMGGGEMIPDYENQIFFIELMDRRKAQFKELERKHAGNNYAFKTKIVLGNAFQSISSAIVEEDPDLVVMGSKGSSGMEEVLIGSNTEKVVRSSHCPVLTVKAAANPEAFKKIVFASDFREDQDELAGRLKSLQKWFDADLYLVIINTPGSFETTRESAARIKKFANKYNIEHAVAEIYNSNSEEAGIVEFAEDIDADMIAMATHGRSGLIHLFTGSIAEDVVNHAKRPVWTFKIK